MYVDHMLATNDSQLGARILLLALHSVHSYSAPAARCQIICSSMCTPPRRAAQRLAWVRLPARLIPVSRRGGGGGGGSPRAAGVDHNNRPTAAEPPLCCTMDSNHKQDV